MAGSIKETKMTVKGLVVQCKANDSAACGCLWQQVILEMEMALDKACKELPK